MSDSGDRVVVRMYRGILGDCFLITVWRGGTPKVAMIDCGVLQNVQPGTDMLTKLPQPVIDSVGATALGKVEGTKQAIGSIEADIVAYLAEIGGKLDVVVMTHDHYDHVAGFTLPDDQNVFLNGSVAIDQLWLSWVENPSDPDARKLAARFSKGKEAVALAAEVGRRAGASASMAPIAEALEQVQALAAFVGPVEHSALGAVTSKTKTTTQAIQAMREKPDVRVRFLEPGQVLPPMEGFGLRTYVLAPPRDEKRLFKDSPTGKPDSPTREVYLTDVDEAAAVTSVALSQLHGMALAASDGQTAIVVDDDSLDPLPFARPYRRPYPDEPGTKPKLRPDGWAELRTAYEDPANEYRSVSTDWTEAAGALALKLDSDTNNSSLVLAFELPDGRVLLFPGDAQVGNWESWGDQLYPRAPDPNAPAGERQQTIEEILGRVVFYKVGHHASHNATARSRGLELMTDKRLCAAIPVVEAVAKVQGPGKKVAGKGWKMPFEPLYTRLASDERTAGRIVIGDGDPERERVAFAAKDVGVSVRHEDHDTGGRWVELTFPL